MDELAAAVPSPRSLTAKTSCGGGAGGDGGASGNDSAGGLVGGRAAEEVVDINSMGDGVDRAKIEVSVVPKQQPQAKQKCVFTANATRVRHEWSLITTIRTGTTVVLKIYRFHHLHILIFYYILCLIFRLLSM